MPEDQEISPTHFQQFFFGKDAKDSKTHTLEQIVDKTPDLKHNTVITMQQVHGCNIVNVADFTNTAKIKMPNSPFIDIKNTDACYTTLENVFLSVKSADCLPILVWGYGLVQTNIANSQPAPFSNTTTTNSSTHPTPFVAVAHAGRKGTQSQILSKLLDKLELDLKISATINNTKNPNQTKLNIWFGPAICVDCYQIDRQTDLHYDLIAENKKQLENFLTANGIDKSQYLNLEISEGCTFHHPEKYYSYRQDGPDGKMNYSLVGIKTPPV
jgi:copper oxidase (laccase) domain-containing protein